MMKLKLSWKKAKWKRNKAKLKYLCLCHKNINLFIGVETVEALEASKNSMRKGFFLFSYWCLLACWCSLLLLKCSIGLNHLVFPNCHVLLVKTNWLKAFFSRCKNVSDGSNNVRSSMFEAQIRRSSPTTKRWTRSVSVRCSKYCSMNI